MIKIPLYLGLVLLVLTGCRPVVRELPPSVPSIRILSLSPETVTEFKDDLLLEIEYTDFDGDVGSEDPDEKLLFVQDSRLDIPDGYHVPPIAPVGQEVPVSGTLVIPLNRLFLLGNGQEEEVFFTVAMRDRAGHWTDEVVTPTVKVIR